MKVFCSQCNGSVQVTPSILNKHKHFFCSNKCESLFKEVVAKISCAVCGKDNFCTPAYAKQVKNITCNNICLSKLKEKTRFKELLKEIDTEGKAYLLGWLTKNPSLTLTNPEHLYIACGDMAMINQIFMILGAELPIDKDNEKYITISSKEIIANVRKHLGISEKCNQIQFPNLKTNSLKIAFIRGVLECCGQVKGSGWPNPSCTIHSPSDSLRKTIGDFMGIPHYDDKKINLISWSGNSALDFLGKIYEEASYFHYNIRETYNEISSWVSGLNTYSAKSGLYFRWTKVDPKAVTPSKERASDSGFDITAIKVHKQLGKVTLYDTGIKVQPEFGWYFDLVPRSSIIKSGYILANSVGIIDRTYTGNVMIALMKIDDSKPDIELPIRIAQLIPRPAVHMDAVEVANLDETNRGEGGFGSTGA